MSKKEEKKAAKAERKKAGKGIWNEFKEFINRGNAFMLAVGVVIGGAFSAIVTAVVNILMSVCTWGVPGGLTSLVTILPAAPGNTLQNGLEGVGQWFTAADFTDKARALGEAASAADPVTYGTNMLNANYTKYGAKWVFNGAAVINWGALINAAITFLIIAIVLFAIVKVVNSLQRKKDELKAKQLEAYYEKHPEERPIPPEPGVPEPTEKELLAGILAELKKSNGEKPEKK